MSPDFDTTVKIISSFKHNLDGERTVGDISRHTGGWGIAAMNVATAMVERGILETSGDWSYRLTPHGKKLFDSFQNVT